MALGIGKAGRKARRATRQAGRKAKISSFRGDGNALKSKFGIGRSLSNKFDQRIGDGLKDLLSGALGSRTSNIPQISEQVKAANEANRQERHDALNMSKARDIMTSGPLNNTILVFPQEYFDEKGANLKGPKYTDQGTYNPDQVANPEAYSPAQDGTRSESEQTADIPFPNSIHFRSLPRKKVDTSEAQIKFLGYESASNSDGDVIPGKDPVYDIFLYLPHNLGDAVKVSWEDAEAGIVDTFFARLFAGGSGVNDMMGERKGVDWAEMLNMVKGMLPGGAIIQRAAGAMANPMKFQTFKGVTFGSYTYKFTLSPTSIDESDTIRHIIHALKLSTLPGTAGANSRIWTLPNEWVIKFQGPIKQWIDFPLTVVCESVDVNYASGEGYTLMDSGAPQAIDLTLTFKETTQQSRQKYSKRMSAHMHKTRVPASGSDILPRGPVITPGPDVPFEETLVMLKNRQSQQEAIIRGDHPLFPGSGFNLVNYGRKLENWKKSWTRIYKRRNPPPD